MLVRVCPDVAATPSPASHPSPTLAPTLLDDTHTVPTSPLLPIRDRALRLTAPTDDAKTVTLTDPVVGAFVPMTPLTTNDTSP